MKITILFGLLLAIVSCNSNKSKTTNTAGQMQTTATKSTSETGSVSQEEPSEAINTGIYITDGYFYIPNKATNEQIKKKYEEDMSFVALISGKGRTSIKPVDIKVEFSTNDCTGLPEASLYANGEHSYIVLISGLKHYNKEPMPNLIQGMDNTILLPSEPVNFVFNNENYTLYATANINDDVYKAESYRLYLQKGTVTQQLTYIDKFEHNMPSIMFIGDIDGDGYPDLLLQEGYNYEYHKIALYLSSYADEDKLVKNVAVDEEWRDC